MSIAVAIFAKTIGISPVKTRLAKSIGKEKAEEFYKLSVDSIEETMLKLGKETNKKITPYWSVAEKEGVLDSRWKGFNTIWTGEGDLGERLFHVSNKLLKKHKKILIIGTDSPQVDTDILLQSIENLRNKPDNCIIGPAYDGGFYLFGTSFLIDKDIWTSTTYSKNDTLKQLIENLERENIKSHFLKTMGDVDEVGDLKSLYEILSSKKAKLSNSQVNLLNWLETFSY